MVDTAGVIHRGRTQHMNPYKERFAADTDRRTLADALTEVGNIVLNGVMGAIGNAFLTFLLHPTGTGPYLGRSAARHCRQWSGANR